MRNEFDIYAQDPEIAELVRQILLDEMNSLTEIKDDLNFSN